MSNTVNLKYNTENSLWYKVDEEIPYTGEVLQYHRNGQEDSKTRFSGGKIDGVTICWYDDGTKKSEVNFSNGQRDGVSTFWDRDSKVRTKALYSKGKLSLANSWDTDGNEKDPLIEFYYESREAKSVLIVGEFTNWEENPIRMDKVDDTLWFKRVILPKGQYQYRYKIDGQWESDPFCERKVDDESGTENCVAIFSSIEDLSQDVLKKNITQEENNPPKNPEWFAASI